MNQFNKDEGIWDQDETDATAGDRYIAILDVEIVNRIGKSNSTKKAFNLCKSVMIAEIRKELQNIIKNIEGDDAIPQIQKSD